ncbi:MAG: ABC transporter permease [Actinomycetes bacterium]
MADPVVSEQPVVDDDEFRGNYHVYEPYRAGLPRMKPYLRELWRRREFLDEMARAKVRAENMDTLFGRVWTVLSPLLTALTYFLLVLILTRGAGVENYLVFLLSGIFLFSILQHAMSGGAKSVVGAGRMITNTAFPRVMLPLAEVRLAWSEFWPTLIVLEVFLIGYRIPPHWAMLSLIPIFLMYLVLCSGVAMLLATCQVFFRDTRSFVPFVSRIWMYASPVLWTPGQVPGELKSLEWLNPMYAITAAWSNAIVNGTWPPASTYITAAIWSFGLFALGAYVFLSRERDFAVRI